MLNNISFKIKLLLIFLIPLASFAVTSVYLLNKNSADIKQLQQTLYETSYKAQSYVLNADRDMYQALTAYQALHINNAGAQADGKALHDEFNENVAQVEERVSKAQALLVEEEASITEITGQSITELLERMSANFSQWAEQAESNINGGTFADESLHQQFTTARSDINVFGEMLEEYVAAEMELMNADNRATALATYSFLIGIGVIIAAAGIFLVYSMNKSVSLVLNKTRQVAQGNLQLAGQERYGKDELGQILQSVDEMIARMRELVGNISASTNTVAVATTQLTTSADESYASTTDVAAHIKEVNVQVDVQATVSGEVSIAMEEMAIGIQKIAESTTSITELAVKSNGEAEQGTVLMEQLKQQMQEMLSSIQLLSQRINGLHHKSSQIGAITENISTIANQTSILSLNASIEAARAGEFGRGFAVVAEEIRKLAASSLAAATNIAELISETRSEIAQVTQYMGSTVEQGEKSGELVEHAAHGFQEIAQVIRSVSEQLHDSSAITEQMSASSEEVSASMFHASSSAKQVASKANSVARATDEQLEQVQHINEAASSLQAIVGQLNQAVNQFRLQ